MKSSLKLLALLICASATSKSLQAQNFDNWTGGGVPGDWNSNGNWSLNAPPGTQDSAEVGITASITLPTGNTTIGLLELENAPITLVGNSGSFTTELFGTFDNASGTLTLSSGFLFTATSDENIVGADGNSNDGLGSGTLTVTGSGTLSFSSNFQSLYVGTGTTGVMNQFGGTVSAAGTVTIGSDGDLLEFSTTAGTGVYNLNSGTFTDTAGEIDLGSGSSVTEPTSSGTLNIVGGELDAGTLAMGINGDLITDAVNGDSGVVMQSGGTANIDTLLVGESTGGSGVYNLSNTGTFSSTSSVVLGDQAGAAGTFNQMGGTSTFTNLTIGESGTGTFNLSGGDMTVAVGGAVTLGDQTGSTGVFKMTGGTLTTVDSGSAVNVGNDGNGLFTQSGGTVTLAGALNVGVFGGSGTYTLSGGLLTENGTMTIGGGGIGVFNYNGGTLSTPNAIFVNNGGTFNQGTFFDLSSPNSVSNPVTLANGAVYNLNAGELIIGGDIEGGTSGISGVNGAALNFNGGTLTTSSAFTDELQGAVAGTNTINTAAGNATLSGALTGAGTFAVTGGGTLDVSASSSASAAWGVDVQQGTLAANAANFPATGNIQIETTGTVVMADSGTNALSGEVSGAGAFTANFAAATDTLELAGLVNLSGVTTLSGGGTLQVLNGTLGDIMDGGIGGNNLVIGAASGTGSVTITGAASYTGSTTINPGYTLTASGLADSSLVTNSGTLGLNDGSPIGSTFTTGGLVSTGTLLVRMGTGVTDSFHIVGTGTVSGVVELIHPGVSGTFIIVSTDAAGDLTDNGLTLANDTGRLFTGTLTDLNNQDIQLVTTSTTLTGLAGIQLTPNELAAANALDALISPNLPANLSQLLVAVAPTGSSNAQVARNLEELTPQSLQYSQAIAYEHSAFLVGKVDSFDNALHHEFSGFDDSAINITMPGFDSGLGRQMSSMLAFDPPSFHQSAPNGINYYPDGQSSPSVQTTDSPSSPEPSSQVISDSPEPILRAEPHTVIRKPYSNFSVFVGGDGTVADLNQASGAANAPSTKASYSAEDAIVGVSYRMTSNLAAGILFDYSHTDADTDANGSKTTVDSYSPGVFATYGDKGFYVNGLFSYGRNNYSNQRAIPVINQVANSNPDGNQYTAALDSGYDFHPAAGWTLTPAGGLTYTHLDIDSFTETGAAPANLSVQSQSDDSLRSRLGGYVTYEVHPGQLTLIPSLSAMWQHEFLDEDAPLTSQFSDLSSGAFTIHSASMGRDSALIGVGLTAELDNSMALFINCTADVNGNYNAENFVGGVKGSF